MVNFAQPVRRFDGLRELEPSNDLWLVLEADRRELLLLNFRTDHKLKLFAESIHHYDDLGTEQAGRKLGQFKLKHEVCLNARWAWVRPVGTDFSPRG